MAFPMRTALQRLGIVSGALVALAMAGAPAESAVGMAAGLMAALESGRSMPAATRAQLRGLIGNTVAASREVSVRQADGSTFNDTVVQVLEFDRLGRREVDEIQRRFREDVYG